jgi:hypothetical protein
MAKLHYELALGKHYKYGVAVNRYVITQLSNNLKSPWGLGNEEPCGVVGDDV